MLKPYAEAIEETLARLVPLGPERVGLDACLGRHLAADVTSPKPLPPFSYSAMDGYAVRSADFSGPGPWTLPVRGESRAGGPGPALDEGTVERIFTGAMLPDGADAIVIQENVERTEDTITTAQAVVAGQHVRAAGTDLAPGAVALQAGTRVGPGQLGLLATLEQTQILVSRRPVMTIVSSGDELRAPGMPGPPGSVVDSNSYVLAAIGRAAGAVVRVVPMVGDDLDQTTRRLEAAFAGTDLLVTVGGASVGDHDLMGQAMQALGVEIAFWGIRVKPGKPTAVGHREGATVLVCPGNPGSATLVFSIFGVPILRALQRASRPLPRREHLPILGSHQRRPGREEYLRARLETRDGELCAAIGANQSSGAVTSFAEADALVVLAADRPSISPGDVHPVIRLAELWT